jgi:hypothetical protein
MEDLRAARGMLRQLPARKALRNFTLTRKMVGLKPPLPRVYPIFRFATALATVLLVLTFAINSVGSQMTFGAQAPLIDAGGGYGGCQQCGGGPESSEAPVPEAAATEAPAATELPAAEPSFVIAPTLTPAAADNGRQALSQTAEPSAEKQAGAPSDAFVPVNWQIGLVIIAVISASVAFLLRRYAIQKWK